MRILIIVSFALFFIDSAVGQVGIGTPTPQPSALLDVTSTTKGLLPPRMTTVQREAISNPSPGLIIFNTTTQTLEVYTAYGWYNLQLQIPVRNLLGGQGQELAYCMQQTSDGGLIVIGNSSSSNSGDVTYTNHNLSGNAPDDLWIVRLNANRNIMWTKLLGGAGNDYGTSIQETADGGFIAAGYSSSSASGDVTEASNGDYDYWIIRLDPSGVIMWNRLIGGTGSEKAQSIKQTTDGGYIVAGNSNSSLSGFVNQGSNGGYDYWIVKLDATGNITWNRLLGGAGTEEAYDIVQANDGNYIIAGHSTSSATGNVTGTNHGSVITTDSWIVRLSVDGATVLWNKLIGGNEDETARSIIKASGSGDNYIIAGSTSSSANGDVTGVNHSAQTSPDYWIVKLDRFGNITWNKLLGGNSFEYAYSIKQTTDGGYIVAGNSSSSASGDVTGVNHAVTNGTYDYWIVKLDATGNIVWNRLLGGSGWDEAYSVVQTTDGGYVIAGNTNSSFNGDVTGGNHSATYDIWLIKLSAVGIVY